MIWFTGLSGAGKTSIATWVTAELQRRGCRVEHLDGDAVREVVSHVGVNRSERNAYIRWISFVASRLESHGVFVVVSLLSPYHESRAFARALCANFVEVYVSTPLEECERRDVKGLYARYRSGALKHLPGKDEPYEVPDSADLTINTQDLSIASAGAQVIEMVLSSEVA